MDGRDAREVSASVTYGTKENGFINFELQIY